MTHKRQPSPTALLNPKQFKRQVNADTRYEFRPLRNQLGKEARASANRQRTISKLYRGQTRLDRKLASSSAKDYSNQAKTYNSFLKTVGAQDSADSQRVQSESNAISTSYGGAPSTSSSERATAAAAQRGLSAANYGGYSQQVGGNNRQYLRGLASSHKHEGIGQRLQEHQRGRSIDADKRELAKQRGDFKVKDAGDRRAAERDYLTQTRAFGNDKAATAETARHNRTGEAISQQNANSSTRSSRASAKNANSTAKQDRYDRNHPSAGSGAKGASGSTDRSYANGKLSELMGSRGVGYLKQHKGDAISKLQGKYSINRQTAIQVVNAYIKRHGGGKKQGGWGSY